MAFADDSTSQHEGMSTLQRVQWICFIFNMTHVVSKLFIEIIIKVIKSFFMLPLMSKLFKALWILNMTACLMRKYCSAKTIWQNANHLNWHTQNSKWHETSTNEAWLTFNRVANPQLSVRLHKPGNNLIMYWLMQDLQQKMSSLILGSINEKQEVITSACHRMWLITSKTSYWF